MTRVDQEKPPTQFSLSPPVRVGWWLAFSALALLQLSQALSGFLVFSNDACLSQFNSSSLSSSTESASPSSCCSAPSSSFVPGGGRDRLPGVGAEPDDVRPRPDDHEDHDFTICGASSRGGAFRKRRDFCSALLRQWKSDRDVLALDQSPFLSLPVRSCC